MEENFWNCFGILQPQICYCGKPKIKFVGFRKFHSLRHPPPLTTNSNEKERVRRDEKLYKTIYSKPNKLKSEHASVRTYSEINIDIISVLKQQIDINL